MQLWALVIGRVQQRIHQTMPWGCNPKNTLGLVTTFAVGGMYISNCFVLLLLLWF